MLLHESLRQPKMVLVLVKSLQRFANDGQDLSERRLIY